MSSELYCSASAPGSLQHFDPPHDEAMDLFLCKDDMQARGKNFLPEKILSNNLYFPHFEIKLQVFVYFEHFNLRLLVNFRSINCFSIIAVKRIKILLL